EIREDEDVVEVRLEAPGMEPDEFELQVAGGYLVIRGEKHMKREDSGGRFYLLERAYGRFERAIPLPAKVDDSRAMAKYRHGVLTIRLPRLETGGSRRIEVKPH
ncbi:MAG TPA: Hsp20/alpha crystallin family protein, partial [Nitrococcus sp.]|nr:Hsp20/alpha crystallin family protein [Nitrococcus sp.]